MLNHSWKLFQREYFFCFMANLSEYLCSTHNLTMPGAGGQLRHARPLSHAQFGERMRLFSRRREPTGTDCGHKHETKRYFPQLLRAFHSKRLEKLQITSIFGFLNATFLVVFIAQKNVGYKHWVAFLNLFQIRKTMICFQFKVELKLF